MPMVSSSALAVRNTSACVCAYFCLIYAVELLYFLCCDHTTTCSFYISLEPRILLINFVQVFRSLTFIAGRILFTAEFEVLKWIIGMFLLPHNAEKSLTMSSPAYGIAQVFDQLTA